MVMIRLVNWLRFLPSSDATGPFLPLSARVALCSLPLFPIYIPVSDKSAGLEARQLGSPASAQPPPFSCQMKVLAATTSFGLRLWDDRGFYVWR